MIGKSEERDNKGPGKDQDAQNHNVSRRGSDNSELEDTSLDEELRGELRNKNQDNLRQMKSSGPAS
ncbi:MAG: hypothetical protein EOO04_19600 [Chitinophagaceae bacterium]|nr:MAG: hypothetical protein EOO04_19600 [Chitinophagaceae bacterium]